MSVLDIFLEIVKDKNLLTRPDSWLEGEILHISEEANKRIDELTSLQMALAIKKYLQDRNMVSYDELIRDNEGNIKEFLTTFKKLPEALENLYSEDILQTINCVRQVKSWKEDGYDIETSMPRG